MNLLRTKLKDYIDIDENVNFDQIIQMIISEFEQQNQFIEEIETGKKKSCFHLLNADIHMSKNNSF